MFELTAFSFSFVQTRRDCLLDLVGLLFRGVLLVSYAQKSAVCQYSYLLRVGTLHVLLSLWQTQAVNIPWFR